jgi:hypothetical protein
VDDVGLSNEQTNIREQVVEQNQPTVSEEIRNSVVIEEPTASSIEQMPQADLLSVILQTIQKGEESRQKDREDDRKCLHQLKQDIVKSTETVTSLFRAGLEALNNKIAGHLEQETTKLAQSMSLLRIDTQLKVDAVNSRMDDIVECVNKKLDDVTNSMNEKIVSACQGMDHKLAYVTQSIETQISNTVPNANHVKELVSTEVERSTKHIVEQEFVTGHTLSGLDNVEVGRQQLYTANLTDTYRGGSSVSSRVCPQGC